MSSALLTTAPPSEAVTTLPEKPELSLAPGVLAWCERYIRQPDGPDAGGPWSFTTEQKRFLFYFYAIDEAGRFIWTRSVLRRAKGWGKSPFMAAIALAELCGPVRYDPEMSARVGQPVGRPVSMPLVQVAGYSEKQTDNTMSMVRAMTLESPIVDDYGLDVGLTRIFTGSGGKLEPITASSQTAEGARPSFAVLDETHHWLAANGGHKLAEVIRRNLGKSRDGSARSIETTNAHQMGYDSVAERSYLEWERQRTGQSRAQNILYDSREAPPDTDLVDEDSLMRGLMAAYGDSTWTDLERIRDDEIYDATNPASESRRFYLNQLSVAEDAWVRPDEWDRLVDREHEVTDDVAIVLGFDGSKSDDWTALIACEVETGYLFPLGIWNPAQYGGEVPRDVIDGTVAMAFGRWDVVGFYGDLHPFESYIDQWNRQHGDDLCVGGVKNKIAWDMTSAKSATAMVEAFYSGIVEQEVRHNGDSTLAQHVYNARRHPNAHGVTVAKIEQSRKIDAAVAAGLAWQCRRDYLALPDNKKRRKKTGRAVFV
jgi:hypothetical protein